MRYQPLPATFHTGRRRAYAEQLPAGAVAVIDTNALLVRSRDTDMPFRPDSYFYYLTGIDQPGAVLLITRDHEQLFVPPTSAFERLWGGAGLSLEQATARSGVADTAWLSALAGALKTRLADATSIQLNVSDPLPPGDRFTPARRRQTALRRAWPGLKFESARPALARLRMVKQPAELEQLRRAIAITVGGFERAQRAVRSGMMEYELEAEFTAEFIRQGAAGYAYEPIVASGAGTTVLHYINNDQRMATGELLLLDIGAEYGWYAADVSRTWPVSGRFSARQLEVYEAVLEAQQAAMKQMVPGASMRVIEQEVCRYFTDQLINLGAFTRADAAAAGGDRLVRKYYPHAPHHLGLDCHDAADYSLPLAPGMVHTIEPGLYFPEEQIGVRLEDDLLITAAGNENLTAAIPIEPAAVQRALRV